MNRIPPKEMAKTLVKILRKQRPDTIYLKKTFLYIREELELRGDADKKKKLPELMTEKELKLFYEAVWKSSNRMHMILLKLLLFSGIRISELVNIKIKDLDLDEKKIRIEQGKGNKDRYVLFPKYFQSELALYVSVQEQKKATYLFESNRLSKYSTRGIRKIVKKYAHKAGIEKRIHPHLFRHHILTYLTKKGIIDAKIQLMSGHKNRESLSIYQDLSLADIEQEYFKVMKDFPIQ